MEKVQLISRYQYCLSIILMVVAMVLMAILLTGCNGTTASTEEVSTPQVEEPRNVIFFHPDGYGLSHWHALRFWLVGPDGKLNWDRLSYMAPYTEHMKNSLTSSSHGGATTHAYGVKVVQDSYGLDGDQEITALSGKKMSIMEEAMEAGFATALVQTGRLTEPGTAVFVASAESRGMREEQALQVIKSGVDVILGGGEGLLLPKGITGHHGEGERADGVNLIEKANELGYTVVYTRDELMAVRDTATKVLGVFAHCTTYNDMTEEELRDEGLSFYVPGSPTIAEMSAVALEVLSRNPKATEKGIFIVAEEEACDNFPNDSNASGSFEAGKRADEAFGIFVDFVAANPNTLLITTADSSAGGKNIISESPEEMLDDGFLVEGQDGKLLVGEIEVNSGPDGEFVLAPLDGIDGAGTEPFLAAPDKKGNRGQFAVAWITESDVSGGIVARAKGLNAEKVTRLGVVDNIDIYRIMYYTLFGEWLGEPLVEAH